MTTLRERIMQQFDGKRILWLFLITNLLYVFMLTVTIPGVMAFADGMKLPDMMPGGYDADHIRALFGALGEAGRRAYATRQLPADMVYPGLFAVTYSLITAHLLLKLHRLDSPWIFLCIAPVIAGTADYLENFGIMAMLVSYPDIPDGVIAAANACTLLKSSMTTLAFTAILLLLGIRGWRIIRPS